MPTFKFEGLKVQDLPFLGIIFGFRAEGLGVEFPFCESLKMWGL